MKRSRILHLDGRAAPLLLLLLLPPARRAESCRHTARFKPTTSGQVQGRAKGSGLQGLGLKGRRRKRRGEEKKRRRRKKRGEEKRKRTLGSEEVRFCFQRNVKCLIFSCQEMDLLIKNQIKYCHVVLQTEAEIKTRQPVLIESFHFNLQHESDSQFSSKQAVKR